MPLYLAGSVVVKAPAGTSSGTCSTTLGATCSASSRGAVTLRHGETQTAAPPTSRSAQDIAADPSPFYLAIHTVRLPAGEVRGQLEAAPAGP